VCQGQEAGLRQQQPWIAEDVHADYPCFMFSFALN
jgi:hypothetical protein